MAGAEAVFDGGKGRRGLSTLLKAFVFGWGGMRASGYLSSRAPCICRFPALAFIHPPVSPPHARWVLIAAVAARVCPGDHLGRR